MRILRRRTYRPGKNNRVRFAGAPDHPLDLVKPPDYELTDQWRERCTAEIRTRIERLSPNGLDAGSREVLHNLINSWVEQSIEELEGGRTERLAIGRMLVGMADQEVARLKPRFDDDNTRASHAAAALAVAFRDLTGRDPGEYIAVAPPRNGDGPLHSRVGSIELHLDLPPAPPEAGTGDEPPLTPGTDHTGLGPDDEKDDRDDLR